MQLQEIYNRHLLPYNLQMHHYRVGAFAVEAAVTMGVSGYEQMCLMAAAGLHDLRNLIKYNFSDIRLWDSRDLARIGELRLYQKYLIETYGTNVESATLKTVKQMGAPPDVIDILEHSTIHSLQELSETWDWSNILYQILLYSDLRVGPSGFVSLDERIADALDREPDLERKERIKLGRDRAKRLEHRLHEANLWFLDNPSGDQLERIEDRINLMPKMSFFQYTESNALR